ncbi:MAG: glycosyltransferase [Bacteroides sp.]|nr:glycosyltransferase [Bacteroides sp.]MCM1413259.1 glycosyltransferase [Bacteroides sp.]MCM1471431.1 glycosyltransferase [Bacteroides sp.]
MIDPIYYSIDLAPAVWGLLVAMVAAMAVIALVMWPRLIGVRRRVAADDRKLERLMASPDVDARAWPAVSVIVYSQADGYNLRTLLPQILNQDYPGPMEVIVVNDESADDTETIVSELELQYPNLYMTFAPERSRNLSRRKLAITLGIKAARYDVLLLTQGNCRVDSPLWMRAMLRHMIGGRRDVVIGYSLPVADDGATDEDARKRRRSFDTMWHAVRYLSAAIHHRPIAGTGCNLAYTRRIFFDHKGYSRTLNLNYGDDDIFVSEIATGENAVVELSHASRVDSLEHSPATLHDTYRMRREFTSRYLRRTPYCMMGLSSVMWWLWPIAGVAGALLALPSLVPAVAVFIIGLAFCLIHMSLWRRCSRALGLRPLFLTVPWLAWGRPWRTLRHKMRAWRNRDANLTHGMKL